MNMPLLIPKSEAEKGFLDAPTTSAESFDLFYDMITKDLNLDEINIEISYLSIFTRTKLLLTQQELANFLNASRNSIVAWENVDISDDDEKRKVNSKHHQLKQNYVAILRYLHQSEVASYFHKFVNPVISKQNQHIKQAIESVHVALISGHLHTAQRHLETIPNLITDLDLTMSAEIEAILAIYNLKTLLYGIKYRQLPESALEECLKLVDGYCDIKPSSRQLSYLLHYTVDTFSMIEIDNLQKTARTYEKAALEVLHNSKTLATQCPEFVDPIWRWAELASMLRNDNECISAYKALKSFDFKKAYGRVVSQYPIKQRLNESHYQHIRAMIEKHRL